jgi:hypothetical protein
MQQLKGRANYWTQNKIKTKMQDMLHYLHTLKRALSPARE